jgi:hypothetical protein
MSKEQIKSLSDSGNVVAAHLGSPYGYQIYWWRLELQIGKTQSKEEIIGKPISDFAYPFDCGIPLRYLKKKRVPIKWGIS